MSKTIKVISIILIIALTVLMIMPPVTVKADTKNEIERFVSITETDQYYTSGAIPVLIYYIIYILASMGYGVFTIGQINDQMANPSFKAVVMEIIENAEGWETGLATMEQSLRSNDGVFNVQADQWANMRETLQSVVDDETFLYAPSDFYLNNQPKFINIGDYKVRAVVVNSSVKEDIRTQYNIQGDVTYIATPFDTSFIKANSISSLNNYIPYTNNMYVTARLSENSAGTSNYNTNVYLDFKRISDNSVVNTENLKMSVYGLTQSFSVIPFITYINNDGTLTVNGDKWKLNYLYYEIRKLTTNGYNVVKSIIKDTQIIIKPSMVEYGTMPYVDHRLKVSITNDLDLVRSTDTVSISTDLAILDQIKQISQTLEDIQISMPAVDDIPVTSTNTIIKEVITNTETIVIPANPAIELDYPEIADLSLPALVMTKFPLSIPFDLFNAFSMFSQTAVKPEFDIPIVLQNAGINTSINISFDHIDGIIEVFRWFILVSFVISLILLTRKIIKG